MNYECINCNLELKIKDSKKKFYNCPNCGNKMIKKKEKEELIRKAKEKLKKYEKQISKEKIKELIGKEEKIYNKSEKGPLKTIKKYIKGLMNLIKDKDALWGHKIIAGGALLYLFSPIDIIPDLIPFAGLIDDFFVISIAIITLKDAIDRYIEIEEKPEKNNEDNINVNQTPIFYYLHKNNEKYSYDYEEFKKYRIWHLKPENIEKYKIRISDDNIQKTSEFYFTHPYLNKTLILLKKYEDFIINQSLNEYVNILSSFGAKEIKYTIQEVKSKKINIDVDLHTLNKLSESSFNGKKEKFAYSEKTESLKFDKSDNLDTKILENCVWYFSQENKFGDFLRNRILNEMNENNLELIIKTGDYISLESKIDFIKKTKVDFDISRLNDIIRKIKIHVKFHPLPNNIKENKEKAWEEIENTIKKTKDKIHNQNKNYTIF